jgi:MFS family permease
MDYRLSLPERRRALKLGLVNAAIWSVGYALTTGTLVNYMAQDLGAKGWQLSLVLAAPSLAGVLRLFTPAIVARAQTAKRAAIGAFCLAYVVLLGLPIVGVAAAHISHARALTILILVTCAHQLLEFIALASLWAWFADLVPLRVRGNYFAWRQTVQLTLTIPIALTAGYFTDHWKEAHKDSPTLMLLGYAIPNALGVACMLSSLVPLFLMPATRRVERSRGIPWRSMIAPFRDWRFRHFLSFRAGLSLANGISQTAQGIFPYRILQLKAGDLTLMRNSMQVGQVGVARWAGPFSDRNGNRPVLVLCQWLVSLAMLFFLFASPASLWQKWLILGAYLLWSAYAGHNVCLPNLALKLAPEGDKSPYVAAHEALASICHAGATVAGGFLFDWLGTVDFPSHGLQWLNAFSAIFLLALLARLAAVPLAAAIREPGARKWSEIIILPAENASGAFPERSA